MMTTSNTGVAKQLIKASNCKTFIEQLNGYTKTLNFRGMAYLGLCGEGAVLDVTDNYETLQGLKVGEKLEIEMSPETRACNPCLINSIHWVGDDIVVNGGENLFCYPQAEELIRGVAQWLRTTGGKNVIFGGVPMGCGSWILPQGKVGTPVCTSSFGWGWVLPYEGHLFARDCTTGHCCYLTPTCMKNGQYGRQYWTSFYAPATGTYVMGWGHRVRNGYLYATLRTGNKTIIEAWDLRPVLDGRKMMTNAVQVNPEWQTHWCTDLVGPCEQGNTIALMSPNTTCVTFYGCNPVS